jgi:hypothetical protein
MFPAIAASSPYNYKPQWSSVSRVAFTRHPRIHHPYIHLPFDLLVLLYFALADFVCSTTTKLPPCRKMKWAHRMSRCINTPGS